jgi:hypothetical protein
MRRARLVLLSIFAATPLGAQWQLSADAGAVHVRQTGIPEANALSFGGSMDALGDRTALRSRVLLSRAADQRWTGQGVVLGSVIGPNTLGPNWEFVGALSGFGQTSASPTTSAEGMARLRIGASNFGGAVGAGAGTLFDATGARPLYHAQATAWQSLRANQLIADVSFVGTVGPDLGNGALADGTRYLDASASWRRDHAGFEIGATAGARAGLNQSASGGWGSVDVTTWVAPNLALVATAGRSLEDVLRGVPRTQYVSLGLRIAARPHSSVRELRPPPAAPMTVVNRAGVILHVDSASRVELMADFTDWEIVALERSGSEWRLLRELPPGLHRLAVRIDGGEWIAPPGLPRATDDFGGFVGLITVP